MEKTFITGGAGYIGGITIRHLIASGYKPESLIIIDNLYRGHFNTIPDGVIFINTDLRNQKEVVKAFQEHLPKTVIHFAGLAYVGESMDDPGAYFSVNFSGGLNILRAMAETGCRDIVFSSTCATYGIPDTIPITEHTPQTPVNPYGESKRMFETALRWFAECHGIRHINLRYFNAAGADFGIGAQHNPETRLIPLALFSALGRTSALKIFGNDYETPDGTCIRDYIHVTDLAEAHRLAVLHLKENGSSESLNLGNGIGTSVLEIIHAAEKVTGIPVPHEFYPRRSGDPAALVAEISRVKKILNWAPRRDLNEIIRSAWEWHCS